ncbi:MAG: carbohydrate ABC transporter permease [Clostridiales bacterium]|nr:carbohydrate ABC transporter permease [Clostridiales bacterium]
MRRINGYDIAMYIIIALFSVCCLLPMLLVAMVSITDEASIVKYGYQLIPESLSVSAYAAMFRNGSALLRSYGISIAVTLAGTLAGMTITGMAGYALANRELLGRGVLSFYFFFTMLFSGGLVPWYIICQKLGLLNNIYALIVPNLLFSCFNMFLVRNFMAQLPAALRESAKIDGAGEFRIAFRIYFPLSTPVLATIALFISIAYWNDWWNAIMLVDDSWLYPLQYYLFKLQSDLAMLEQLQNMGISSVVKPPTESVKMATVVVTVGPIILLYPYLQRYFVKGLVIGSVKG